MRFLLPAIILAMAGCHSSNTSSTPATSQNISMDTIFTAPDFIKQGNVYEVNLRQYSMPGTIRAFEKELPRLKEMGVQTLWFMPITPIAMQNRKGSLGSYYAASDYTSVSPEFGTVADFTALVKHAHDMGFKVIMDWVANHTGWDHIWTKTHPDYFQKDSTGTFKIASGMDDIIELDFANPALRKAMIESMGFWVDTCQIDGFRCDLAFWVELDFWKEARHALEQKKKLFWLGEFDPLEQPDYLQAFDAAYTWTWMHKTQEFYEGKLPFHTLDSLLDAYTAINHQRTMSLWFTTNHDENSWNGTEYEKYGKLAPGLAVFSATWEGIPLVYSGQELPNMKRLKFFEKDPIAWTGTNALQGFYKTLLDLRTTNPALSAGDTMVHTHKWDVQGRPLIAFDRVRDDRKVVVVINFSGDAQQVNVDDKINGLKEVMGYGVKAVGGKLTVEGWGYGVWER